MNTVTQTKAQATNTANDYLDGKFDASIGVPPKTTSGDYFTGYIAHTAETGKAPF